MKRAFATLLLILTASIGAAAEPTAFSVRVVGHGRPMILIPGLASSADVWNTTVAHFKDRNQCHVLNLAGFGGQPRIDGPLLAAARTQVAAYIRDQHLEHPIIVGHSLGGFLALAVAADEPKLVGPVIAVDGVPFLPALFDPNATVASAAAQAEGMRKAMAGMNAEQFAAQNRMALASMITSPADVDAVAATGGRSDPVAVGTAVAELMTTDLRPLVARIVTPVLLIAAGGALPTPEVRKSVAASYEAQIATIPNHRFAMAENARHFIMLDDPGFLFSTMDAFLSEKR